MVENLGIDELVELEQTLKQSLSKVHAELKIANEMKMVSCENSSGKKNSASKLVGVNKSSKSKN
jgi:hypothetical protein